MTLITSVDGCMALHDSHYLKPIISWFMDENHIKTFQNGKKAGIKIVNCQETLEQGRVVSCTGVDRHRDRHA